MTRELWAERAGRARTAADQHLAESGIDAMPRYRQRPADVWSAVLALAIAGALLWAITDGWLAGGAL